MSMGQRQRLRLAMTLLASPRLLLLDEPLTSLDADGAGLLFAAVQRLCRGRRRGAVVLAHRRAAGSSARADAHAAGRGARRAMSEIRAFIAVLRRDLTVYLSYRTRLVSQALTSLFSLTLFYYVSRLVRLSGLPDPEQLFRVRRRRHRDGRRPLLLLPDPRTGAPGAARRHLRAPSALAVRRRCARSSRCRCSRCSTRS